MDVIIPSHNVRTFSSSIACLTKIGKELYVDFDPLDGLTLRTLNDAKSAYGSFRFSPGFFERCAAPPQEDGGGSSCRRSGKKRSRSRGGDRIGGGGGGGRRRRGSSNSGDSHSDSDSNGGDGDDDDSRYVCRAPLRTVHAVLRTRKGVHTLRIRSVGAVSGAGGLLSPSQSQSQSQSQTHRRRGGGPAVPVTPDGNPTASGTLGGRGGGGARMQLSFEYQTVHPKSGGTMRTVHRLGVTDADAVAAVASKVGCSEIVSSPRTILKLLDPLKRTAEVALTVDDVGRVVTATSFHHGDAAVTAGGGGSAAEHNSLSNAQAASLLKTETSIGVDEFVEERENADKRGTLFSCRN